MAYPSTFVDIQRTVIAKARLDANADTATGSDLQKTKDYVNRAYAQVYIEVGASVSTLTASLTAGTSRYALTTTASGVNALNSATVNVVDASFFPSSGFFFLNGVLVTYTGKTVTSLTGCGNHAATAGGELVTSSVGRLKQMAVKPSGSTLFNPPLILTSLDEILRRRQAGGDAQTTGTWATHYTLLGANDLELWPTPSAADTITAYYAAYPTPLSAITDAPALEEPYATNLLEYGALLHAGDFKGDPATVSWQADYDAWMAKYNEHLRLKKGELPGQFHQWGDGNWDLVGTGTGGYY